MPSRPRSACAVPGCPRLAVQRGRCATHQPVRAPDTRPSPSARGYDRAWQRIRECVLQRDATCVECGAPATDVDHILPLRSGGSNDLSNLQGLCHACHARKTSRQDGGWGMGVKSPEP